EPGSHSPPRPRAVRRADNRGGSSMRALAQSRGGVPPVPLGPGLRTAGARAVARKQRQLRTHGRALQRGPGRYRALQNQSASGRALPQPALRCDDRSMAGLPKFLRWERLGRGRQRRARPVDHSALHARAESDSDARAVIFGATHSDPDCGIVTDQDRTPFTIGWVHLILCRAATVLLHGWCIRLHRAEMTSSVEAEGSAFTVWSNWSFSRSSHQRGHHRRGTLRMAASRRGLLSAIVGGLAAARFGMRGSLSAAAAEVFG